MIRIHRLPLPRPRPRPLDQAWDELVTLYGLCHHLLTKSHDTLVGLLHHIMITRGPKLHVEHAIVAELDIYQRSLLKCATTKNNTKIQIASQSQRLCVCGYFLSHHEVKLIQRGVDRQLGGDAVHVSAPYHCRYCHHDRSVQVQVAVCVKVTITKMKMRLR